MSRAAVYRRLRRLLDIPEEAAHVAMLDKEQCRRVLAEWENHLPEHLRNLFIMPQVIPNQEQE